MADSVNVVVDDYIDVEYRGDPEVLDDVTRMQIAMGQMPRSAANVLRNAAVMRCKAVKNVNKRKITRKYFPGLSRDYTFGPKTFVGRMLKSDYQIVKNSTSAHQFKRVGDPADDLILPRNNEANIVLVDSKEWKSAEEIHQAISQSSRR